MNKNLAIAMLTAAIGHFLASSSFAEPPTFDRESLINSYSAHVRP